MLLVWASDEWFAELKRSASLMAGDSPRPRPGFDLCSQYVVTDTPQGTIKYVERIKDGRMAHVGLGTDQDPDLTVTIPYADYQRIFTELKSSHEIPTAKIEGRLAILSDVRSIRGTDFYKAHKTRMRDITRWP